MSVAKQPALSKRMMRRSLLRLLDDSREDYVLPLSFLTIRVLDKPGQAAHRRPG